MKKLLLLIITLSIVGCNTTQTQERKPQASQPVADNEIDHIEMLGNKIFFHDQLAWKATDMILEEKIDPAAMAFYGWITFEVEDGWIVRFFSNKETLTPLYDVHFPKDGKADLSKSKDDSPTERDLALLAARNAVIESVEQQCSETYNTVVFESPEENCIYAYALAATDRPGSIMIGGHYRVKMSFDGKNLISKRRFSNGCLEMNRYDAPGLPEGAQIAAFSMSHVLDTTPMETHVFLSKTTDLPLYVVTDSGMWRLEDGNITWLKGL